MIKRYQYLIGLLIFSIISNIQAQEKTWRFINLPDYHYAEGFSIKGSERDKRIEKQTEKVRIIKSLYGGDLITIPGDAVSGH